MGYFYFIRHAPTINNIKNKRCGGDLDLPLIENYSNYLKNALDQISYISINKIYTSRLIRTNDTSKLIANFLSNKPQIILDDRLKERTLGNLNHQSIKQTQIILKEPPESYGIEGEKEFRARVLLAIDEIRTIESNNIKNVLIVSSKGVARVFSENFKYAFIGETADLYLNCQLIKFYL
jgi:broad specificity phosphatase PhoE